MRSGDSELGESRHTFTFGEFELDFGRGELRRRGQPADLQATPLRVLLYLAENRDRTVSKQELLDELWPDTLVTDTSLANALNQARQAVGDDGTAQRVIRTLKGRGYRFVADSGLGIDVEAPVERRRAPQAILAAALLIVLAVAGGLLWSTYTDRGPEAIPGDAAAAVPWFAGAPAIAVLPFDNFSGDPDQEYFVDGMTDQLITLLSNWGDFPVIARNSTFTYKGRTVDVRDVGRELGARYVVEGRVSKAGDRVRISAQLTDATTGHNVWAKTYDRELEDLFAVQDEIAESIVAALYPELLRSEHERAAGHKSKDLASYDLLMRGYWHQFQQTEEDNAKARAFFERAIELEPSYAAAWAGLSFTHGQELDYRWTDDPARSREARDRAARRCVALNSENAVCSLALGGALFQSGETSKALSALQRSIELNPNFSYAHALLGAVLVVSGQPEEGIVHLERALRLDAKNPAKAEWLDAMSTAQFAAGHYEEAVDRAKQSIQINPDRDSEYRSLAVGYAQLGRIDEARAAVADALRIDPDLTLEKVRRQIVVFNPDADLDFIERQIDGLRKAGLPEE